MSAVVAIRGEAVRSSALRYFLFRERNILLVLFRHRFAIARRYCTAVDRLIDLLLSRHLRRLLFLRRVLGRSRRRGGGCRRRGCRCRCWRSSRLWFSIRRVLGHQDACRHAHEHRCGRHNTRKFLHPKPPVLSCLTSEIVNVIRRPTPCNLACVAGCGPRQTYPKVPVSVHPACERRRCVVSLRP
jgi:hypothetical protein